MKVLLIKAKHILIYLSTFLLVILSTVLLFNFKKDDPKIVNTAPLKELPVYSVQNDDNKIALTFDCAWGIKEVDTLLNLLKDTNVKATFFVTGEWCDKYGEVVKNIATLGHSVQNHSNTHPHVLGMDKKTLFDDTVMCDNKIKAITNASPKFYRAPYGEYDVNLLQVMKQEPSHIAVQWDVDSRDWQKKSVNDMVKNVVKNTSSGSIILFHTDISNSVVALKGIIPKLLEKKFSFVTIDELLIEENYTIDNNGRMNPSPK
ncbi:MAG: polysaccharide deacetylase family protein [Oscillospiraceae bacterium]